MLLETCPNIISGKHDPTALNIVKQLINKAKHVITEQQKPRGSLIYYFHMGKVDVWYLPFIPTPQDVDEMFQSCHFVFLSWQLFVISYFYKIIQNVYRSLTCIWKIIRQTS